MLASTSSKLDRALAQDRYLGPVTVLSVAPRSVEVRFPSGENGRADLALGYPYTPAVDDVLLVIADERAAWVIGVVEGRGKTSLPLHGDVSLHATGSLTLSAEEGVRVRAPELEIGVEKLTMAATSAVQKFATLYQRVREVLTVHAREAHQIVDETAVSKAKKHAILAEETASVNGKQILLG